MKNAEKIEKVVLKCNCGEMRTEIITVFCLVVLIYTAYWTMESFGRVRRRFYTSLSYAVPSEPNVAAPAAEAPKPAAPKPRTATSKTIEERCERNNEPYSTKERCVYINNDGKNRHPKWLKDNLSMGGPFCNNNITYENGSFSDTSLQSLKYCEEYEEALNERCEEDYGPYDSKNECILVNLYGVHYDYTRRFHESERFDDSVLDWTQTYPPTAAGAPEPAAGAPEPAAEAPEPAAGAPEPAAEAPEPAAGAQQPAAGAPEPAAGAQQPAAEAPEPAVGALEPAAEAAEPAEVTQESIEERCQKEDNNYLFKSSIPGTNFCTYINETGNNSIDNVLNVLNEPGEFCDNEPFSDMNFCNKYEDAFKKICEDDYEPYDNKKMCTLVNLYGTYLSYSTGIGPMVLTNIGD